MNYVVLIIRKLEELRQVSPDLTFGDIVYSLLRKDIIDIDCKKNISWIRDVDDVQFYGAINKLLKEETDYKDERNT